MKFLTVCQGGNVRSVGLAFVLKYKHNQDAIAASWEKNSPETKEMLYNWADYIVVMQSKFKEHIPEQFHDKLRVVDVGEDRFGYAFHPDLQAFCTKVVDDWKTRDYKI